MGGKAFWLLLFLVEIATAQFMGTEAEYPGVCPMRGNEACNGRLVMSLCHSLWAHQESNLPQYCNRYRNGIHYEVTTLTRDELTPEVLQNFSAVTAEALNRFCQDRVCIVDGQNVTNFQTFPQNVIVLLSTIWTNAAGNPVLVFYVETGDNAFVSEETLQLAVDSAGDLYSEANFEEPPELKLRFINDSPVVSGRDVTVYISSSDRAATLTCRMTGQRDVDCSSGMVHYSNLAIQNVGDPVTLTVEATTNDGRVYEISRKLRLEEPGYCTVHLINDGVSVHDGQVTFEFATTGYTVSTACIMDPQTKPNRYFDCTSPLTMDVSPGKHKFKIVPKGCYDYRFPVKVVFEVPAE